MNASCLLLAQPAAGRVSCKALRVDTDSTTRAHPHSVTGCDVKLLREVGHLHVRLLAGDDARVRLQGACDDLQLRGLAGAVDAYQSERKQSILETRL